MPKLRQMDLAWPMWRYPFGSGGKRVATRPACLPLALSALTISRMKSRRSLTVESDIESNSTVDAPKPSLSTHTELGIHGVHEAPVRFPPPGGSVPSVSPSLRVRRQQLATPRANGEVRSALELGLAWVVDQHGCGRAAAADRRTDDRTLPPTRECADQAADDRAEGAALH